MSKTNKRDRQSLRKRGKVQRGQAELFLYGKLKHKNRAQGYCFLHHCYLDTIDIVEKRCNKKHCKYFKEVI